MVKLFGCIIFSVGERNNFLPTLNIIQPKSNDWEVGFFMAKHSFEIKKKIVSEYLLRNKSSSYLARKYGITNKNEILKWVAIYKTLGDDGLMRSRKNKNETRVVKNIVETSVDTSAEHIKQLEDELLKLRIENAYLKELRRLRLEEEALLKKQRE